jgi:predicted Mrr-cat superfamily restriction endonuclease
MSQVYCIITHHKRPNDAARAWKRLGVCAIGWASLGNIKNKHIEQLHSEFKKKYPNDKSFNNIVLFRQIRKGDLILAYAGGNTIAYVGTVIGSYKENHKNEVGSEKEFGYPNQYPVDWWSEPRYFSRKNLPLHFSNQFGKRGKTVTQIDLGRKYFDDFKKIILECAESDSQQIELNEDMVKAGLQKYLNEKIFKLEKGLTLDSAEYSINKENRPDFIATDSKRKKVIIECKGWAHVNAVEQILNYKKQYGHVKPRLMLIAFKIDSECKKAAKKEGIEIIECELEFSKL